MRRQFQQMSNLEEQLILSQLPYPKYYNGYNWNTIIANTRKHIPQYLHEDLPKLKFEPIREEFKKLNKIECPRLAYFNTRIQEKLKPHQHHSSRPKPTPHRTASEELQGELKHIRSELQYALLTSDRNSNVIKKLVSKAADLEEELATREGKAKRRSNSVVSISQRESCFQNTLDIVITARKQLLRSFREQEAEEGEIKIKAVLLPYVE